MLIYVDGSWFKDVSIPFREELHSDANNLRPQLGTLKLGFHPFQGRAPFGRNGQSYGQPKRCCYVSIPFREELHSDEHTTHLEPRTKQDSFHPFQGRAPFGHVFDQAKRADFRIRFPSLSGKSSIRTNSRKRLQNQRCSQVSIPFREELHSDKPLLKGIAVVSNREFPSLSGKSSIRTNSLYQKAKITASLVSIPFREELHSDFDTNTKGSN